MKIQRRFGLAVMSIVALLLAVDLLERRNGREIRHDVEPGAGFRRHAAVEVLSWLPIEWLL